MGVVHLALDPHGRAVAIKVLRAHVAHDRDARARLAREVQTPGPDPGPARRRASSTPTSTATGPTSSPATSPGRRSTRSSPSTARCAATRCCGSGRGLVRRARPPSTRAGVVHRDLKPATSCCSTATRCVIDFGIAHVADDVRLTMTGLVMGTPGYLSPEVVEGAPVTTATDWWGWAATLAFAASGQPPFGRGPMDVVLDRVRRGQADLSGVDPRLAPLLAAALSPQLGRASARRRDRRGPRPLRGRCARRR